MEQMDRVRQAHINLIKNTLAIIENILQPVNHTLSIKLTDPKDGLKGWTILTILCHLRDFDIFFLRRAELMLKENYPTLPAHDHEALVLERAYHNQKLDQVLSDLSVNRNKFINFFENLTSDEWNCAGLHPEKGHFTMTDAVMQVGMHDITHIKQITSILTRLPDK